MLFVALHSASASEEDFLGLKFDPNKKSPLGDKLFETKSNNFFNKTHPYSSKVTSLANKFYASKTQSAYMKASPLQGKQASGFESESDMKNKIYELTLRESSLGNKKFHLDQQSRYNKEYVLKEPQSPLANKKLPSQFKFNAEDELSWLKRKISDDRKDQILSRSEVREILNKGRLAEPKPDFFQFEEESSTGKAQKSN